LIWCQFVRVGEDITDQVKRLTHSLPLELGERSNFFILPVFELTTLTVEIKAVHKSH